ncbi:NADH-quinone oxidoreductase subunit N [Glycomyces buryatensis]|nr:proton-conducting transporter membrane subunit [Glycomyces buryatensis]
MVSQPIDHAALLPLYLAAATAAVALFAGRLAKACTMIGLSISAGAAIWIGVGADRRTFAVGEWHSYIASDATMGLAALFALLTVLVAALSARAGAEYCFLLAASAAGGITLAGSGDLITLIVALETLTVPLYVLVTRPGRDGAEAGVTFLIASIASSATALMGAALLYAASGTVHFAGLATELAGAHPGLVAAGVALLLGGLAFKLAAAPLHAWAPLVLERAPLPIATYLASASKLGGAVAITWVVYFGLAPQAGLPAGIVLAALSVASIAVGNVAALVQRRTVSLLAWSGIAHAGYVLAPLAALATAAGRGAPDAAASAALAYAVFFVLLEAGAFAALTAVRPDTETETATATATAEKGRTPEPLLSRGDLSAPDLKVNAGTLRSSTELSHPRATIESGGPQGSDLKASAGNITELAGLFRTAPLPATVFLIAVVGLSGLPPALAGTFAKIVILEFLASSAVWLAIIVAAGAIVGLAYYLPLARTVLLGRGTPTPKARFTIAVAVIGLVLLAIGLAPQTVLEFTRISQ